LTALGTLGSGFGLTALGTLGSGTDTGTIGTSGMGGLTEVGILERGAKAIERFNRSAGDKDSYPVKEGID